MDVLADLSSAFAGRYRLERELGRGATAVVYLARDLRHDRDVAIKVLHAELTSGEFSERFLREIHISAGLQHPHILSLHDSGEVGGRLFCVMPYVSGESLRDRLRREKALPIADALRLTRQVAEALVYAHEHGVVHRDIKPENILLSGGQAFVADFGIARAIGADAGDRLTQTGTTIGTLLYMSPEQAAGERDVDGRSDIYSLGCVAYEMLGGEAPFDGPSARSIIARHLQQPAPSLRIIRQTIPEHVDEAVQRALAKSPADRFQRAIEFADALDDADARQSSRAGSRSGAGRRPGAPARRGSRVVMLVVGLLLAASAAWMVLRRWVPSGLDGDLIAIAPFDAGDAALAAWRERLPDLLVRNLNGAGPLRVVPPSVVQGSWSGRADEASAVRLGRKTSARSVVVGAIYARGTDSVRLTATLYDAGTRRLVGDAESVVPLSGIDRGADSLTVAILQVLARERPLGAVRPPSSGPAAMAALKAYLQGEVYYRRTAWDSAQLFFERAGQLDTNYALAFHRLSFVRTMLSSGIDSLIWFHGLRAGRLHRGLPERDSLAVMVDSLQAALWYLNSTATPAAVDSVREPLRRRLLSTLDVATRRYPDDAELWYMQGVHLNSWGERIPGKARLVLDALNRTLALDSAFLPAYSRAINLAATLDGEEAARRYLTAYLARRPTGLLADAARLDDVLLDPARARSPLAEELLAAATPRTLLTAWSPLLWSYDSAETALTVAQRLRTHPDARRLDPRPGYPEFILALTLASRGHVRAACAAMVTDLPHRILFPQLALLGCAARDSAAAIVVRLAARERWQASRVAMYVPWWGAIGDTATLADMRRRGDSVARVSRDAATRATAAFLGESARAYLALMKHDTTEALVRFQAAPDSLCQFCEAQRLMKSRLLDARGMTRPAIAVLSEDLDGNNFPMAFLLRLQRARLSEKVGDHAGARLDYERIARAWERADVPLRDSAMVARAALQRLAKAR